MTHWLGKLANLHVSRTGGRGPAPHKPLMLLSVMDLIEMGEISDRWVRYDAQLVTRFRDYWDLVVERRQNAPEITMPFHALGGTRDAVWQCFDEHGNPSASKLSTRLCLLDADLFACLQQEAFRLQARNILIAQYFTAIEQVGLYTRLQLPIPHSAEIEALKQDAVTFKASLKKGRASNFRSIVGSSYKYTCALTGYRLESTEGYIVQACHIHEHAKSGNDDPRNGLALSPDAHWMFDKGLWTAIPKGDDFLIHVAQGKFTESSPHDELLVRHHQTPLHFHPDSTLRPDPIHFDWHAREKFLGGTTLWCERKT